MLRFDQSRYSLIKLALLLGLLIIISVALVAIPRMSRVQAPVTMELGENIRTGEAPAPEFTADVAARVAASKGFQALASYTDRGFEPVTITIQVGETVRFTNNSSSDLWVAASGEKLYSRTYSVCGSSDLDSCAGIKPMDFYEFTFTEAGEWEVTNNLDKSKTVRVKVTPSKSAIL